MAHGTEILFEKSEIIHPGIHHGVLERFWLQPSLVLCCVAGCGVGMMLQVLKEKASCPALKYFFLSLAVIAIGYQVKIMIFQSNLRNHIKLKMFNIQSAY